MTNVSSSPEKVAFRRLLRAAATTALGQNGWEVERIARAGKSSVRRITKGDVSKVVSIRTTQDAWIAFPRNRTDTGWATLADVDYVVAASVDDPVDPRFINIHLLDADDMRARFDRAYAARRAANYSIPVGRGVWISLYDKESAEPVTHVGAGAGLDESREIGRVPLAPGTAAQSAAKNQADDAPLTINEAKRRLAASLGVDISAIKITVHT